jgi:flagellar biosynthesis protein FlhF
VKVKRFYGESVPEIISKIKNEMGSNAVIIQQRKYRRGGLLGIFRPPMVEVIAAADSDQQRYPYDQQLPGTGPAFSKEIAELKKMITDKLPAGPHGQIYPGHFDDVFRLLIDNDVDEELAREIIDQALHRIDQSRWDDVAVLMSGVGTVIAEYLHVVRQDSHSGKLRLAMIGPTGVGKTTTIAKLAAISSVLKEKSVALITIDTFRVGAVDQLKTYAEIISVPMEVAHTPRELKSQLARHDDKDLVLIDTAGRSPYNKLQIAELKGFLDACPDIKICLVLSVTTNHKDLHEIIMRFGKFPVHELAFTKLDETRRYGNIINVVNGLKKDLAYVTNGQNVPDDIETPAPVSLANLILASPESIPTQ